MTTSPDDALARALTAYNDTRTDYLDDDYEIACDAFRAGWRAALGRQAATPGVPRDLAPQLDALIRLHAAHRRSEVSADDWSAAREQFLDVIMHDAAPRSGDVRQAARAGGEEGA